MAKGNNHLPYQCKYNQIVGCADKNGCASCGWSPKVEACRKAKLRRELNPKPPVKTRQKKRTLAVTWRERK